MIRDIWLKLRFVVVCLVFLNIVGVINVWIFIKIGCVFFIVIMIVELVVLFRCFFKKICEGLVIFFNLCLCILKILILFVELNWFFIVCKIWKLWCCLFLKYNIVFIICFNIFGLVIEFFFVIWLMIKMVILFVLVILSNFVVVFFIWLMFFVIFVMFGCVIVWMELIII